MFVGFDWMSHCSGKKHAIFCDDIIFNSFLFISEINLWLSVSGF